MKLRIPPRDPAAAVPALDMPAFLESVGSAKSLVHYERGAAVFNQGDAGEHVAYVHAGRVKLSVSSRAGREAVVGILGPGDFFGEGCLADQPVRLGSATAMTPSDLVLIPKDRMAALLRKQHAMSDRFIAHMLARNLRVEEDLLDQLFNSSEKRLARALFLLAGPANQNRPTRVPKISQETLAEMIGTTRSRVNFFLNKFKRLGVVEYDDQRAIKINSSLLSAILRD